MANSRSSGRAFHWLAHQYHNEGGESQKTTADDVKAPLEHPAVRDHAGMVQ